MNSANWGHQASGGQGGFTLEGALQAGKVKTQDSPSTQGTEAGGSLELTASLVYIASFRDN